ncbi:hypothetical protein FOJ82_14560 [Tessaracoccus rhinocerotis]|uniref:TIGR02646 family protein n=1 Tax=Tessaracoccus rhinocerotis TaxID=1689449 RepID=A0A553JX93_9ACTN|nr:hypothetical protein [Tessaracoccus rhinocerotis]TRY17066.1 hypothetical protein FOJ82_14560 [Tessaracoccus rhinocerotis]
MRKVPLPAAPPGLDSERARQERADALAFYEDWDGAAKFAFDAYKAADVRPALEVAFGGKCAYCETYYGATQPVAIEHYRPKGAVVVEGSTKPKPPGYYWLASDWTNLLPSCTDCNSPRGQDLPGEHRTAGKANAFPLASEDTRAHAPGEEQDEDRLLLHPYWDFPEKHLTFVWGTDSVSDGWVEPRRSSSGRVSAKGDATIRVCALQRRGLVKARRERLVDLVAHLEGVVEARDNAVAHPDDARFVEQFARRVREVARFVEDHAPYSAMAKQVVAAYHDRLFGPKEEP